MTRMLAAAVAVVALLTWVGFPESTNVLDLRLTAVSKTDTALPDPSEFSAWLTEVDDHDRTPHRVGPPSNAPQDAAPVGQSPDSTRLLVSGSASTGEYLVEGVTTDDSGVWYLLVEVPTPCGTDLAEYVLRRS